jgi:predicted GNAT family acetyltransferase
VMAALLEQIFAEKPLACLFVKTANAPAIALYKRLGFATIGGYVISYYGM